MQESKLGKTLPRFWFTNLVHAASTMSGQLSLPHALEKITTLACMKKY